mmetsp:Transcript_1683/g.5496  ORF Transcript_1683/g.5496 Transcript_1683/m.5496 type:complete len:202 (+) Transcript_1683:1402-2007(+)
MQTGRRHICSLRRAPALRRARQEPADPHQELPERGDEEVLTPACHDGLHVPRRHGLAAAPVGGARLPLRRAAAQGCGGARHTLSQVRGLVSGQLARGAPLQARRRHRKQAAGAALHGARDDPDQVGRVGRQRGICLLDAQPHQVLLGQRGQRHHPHAGRARLHFARLGRDHPLPGPRGQGAQDAGRRDRVPVQVVAAQEGV